MMLLRIKFKSTITNIIQPDNALSDKKKTELHFMKLSEMINLLVSDALDLVQCNCVNNIKLINSLF